MIDIDERIMKSIQVSTLEGGHKACMHKRVFYLQEASGEESHHSAPGRSFPLVVPKRPAGMILEGDRTSANEKLYESVPNLLCNHPLLPENPSATIQLFLKPRLVSVLATIFAESVYLKVTRKEHVNGVNDQKVSTQRW